MLTMNCDLYQLRFSKKKNPPVAEPNPYSEMYNDDDDGDD